MLLQEELQRKKKEAAARDRKVQSLSTDPPDGPRRTHRQLQIIAGSAQNYKLWSPEDMNTRPMMSAVRAAVFSMLTSMSHESGTASALFPPGARWLDLFAGTGAVGIEALSRGVEEAHFVELDPWVGCGLRRVGVGRLAPQPRRVPRRAAGCERGCGRRAGHHQLPAPQPGAHALHGGWAGSHNSG